MQSLLDRFFFVLLVVACSEPVLENPQPQEKKFQLDLKDNWQVSSKTCEDIAVTPKHLESYKFDQSHFIRIELANETKEILCKNVFIYDRMIRGSQNSAHSLSEVGTLKSSAGKKVCWKKQEGVLSQSPISEELFEFGPEAMEFALTVSASRTSMVLTQSNECPEGTLRIDLLNTK